MNILFAKVIPPTFTPIQIHLSLRSAHIYLPRSQGYQEDTMKNPVKYHMISGGKQPGYKISNPPHKKQYLEEMVIFSAKKKKKK